MIFSGGWMNFSDNGKLAAELAQLASSAKLLLMLDFDGTISPIVARPQDAQLDQDLGKILEKLSALPNTEVWIVSGRSLADLKEKVPFTNLIGSHGLECPFLNEKEIDNDDILQLKNKLEKFLKDFKGVQLEEKKYSISVHYRHVAAQDEVKIKEIVERLSGNFVITAGKKVWELRQPGRNKGDVCLALLQHTGCTASIYVGDDVTDEDAFQALQNKSMTIKIGDGTTAANYRLPNIESLRFILKKLLDQRYINNGQVEE